MPPPLPRGALAVLRRYLSPRLFEEVAGDLQERWTADRSISRRRAWHNLLRLTASILWHTTTESRRTASPPPAGVSMFIGIGQDLRFAWRLAVRQPWLTAAAAGTLSLGIAATTAIFSVMHAWILSPLPYRDPDRLVAVWETVPSASIFENTPAPATLSAWRARARSFEALVPFTAGVVNLTGAGEPAQLNAALVSHELLPLLGVIPVLGRNITAAEAEPNGPAVALLTHGTWTTRFGRRPSVVGEVVQLSGVPTTIIGVLPADVQVIPTRPDIWLPLRMTAEEQASLNRTLWVIGRLTAGTSVAAATADVDAIVRDSIDAGLGARVVPLQEQALGSLGRDVLVFFAATSLVLLIACANVASLTLVRITGRRQEILVRTALGARRARIVRQVLTESVAMGIAGGAGGLLLAGWIVRALVTLSPDATRMPAITLTSPAVFGFAFAAAMLTSLLFGIVPAARSAGVQIGSAMREGTTSVAGGGRRMLRLVVGFEVALALCILTGAGLVVRSYQNVTSVDLGFDPDAVVAFQLPRPAAESRGASLAFHDELQRRLAETPGIRSAGLIQALPLRSMAMGAGFRIEGRTDAAASILSYWRVISRDYFDALGIPMKEGRRFDRRDRDGGEKVAIVSESFARRAWPEGPVLGKRIGWGTLDEPLTVVGVVGDVRLSPAITPGPHVYMPFEQVPHRLPHELVVRSDAGMAATIDAVRRTVWTIDASQPVAGIRSMSSLLDDTLRRRRFHLTVFAIAAALALVLALVGIYGVLSYAATGMAAELGIRMALGATRAEIAWQVMRMGLVPVLIGVASGAALTWTAGAGLVRSFLFAVEPTDPLTFGGAAALLLAAATAACLIPAIRSAARDPLLSLRGR